MKQKQLNILNARGFTIVELLVVITIMGTMAALIIVNFANQRSTRALRTARNELVTNIRKVQSYSLSGRDIPGSPSTPAKFYMLRLQTGQNTYSIQGINTAYAFSSNLESYRFPTDVTIDRIEIAQNGSTIQASCVQILFAAPFGKIYAYAAGACGSNVVSVTQDPAQLITLSNSYITIRLKGVSTETMTVTVAGLSGTIY